MKEILKELILQQPDDFRKRSVAREYLQARILLALQDHGAFSNWAFVGGTALRFLYQLPRYSEDLYFSLSRPGEDARFSALMTGVKSDLSAEAYSVEVKTREGRAVASAFIRFQGLLFEAGLSPHRDEVLSIKVEMDTCPPAGAGLETRVIRRFELLNLLHYDPSSLLAGKLHAILMRKYTKGRDLYDLAWYLSDPHWPSPNIELLNNALVQTGWSAAPVQLSTWAQTVGSHLEKVDWDAAVQDVSPFLEREKDRSLVSKAVLMDLLKRKSGTPH